MQFGFLTFSGGWGLELISTQVVIEVGVELGTDMEKVSNSLAVLAEKSKKRLKFGISHRRKFENANLLAEDVPLFLCLQCCCLLKTVSC